MVQFETSDKVRVWFGPPGVGKSTYIRSLKRDPANMSSVVDLEEVRSANGRRTLASQIVNAVMASAVSAGYSDIAAADTQPEMYPSDRFVRILVLPDRRKYLQRRAARNARDPHKAQQPDVYMAFSCNRDRYDLVLPDFPLTGR